MILASLLLLAFAQQPLLQPHAWPRPCSPSRSIQQPHVWISPAQIAQCPTTGPEWNAMKADADSFRASPTIVIANQDDKGDSKAMAAALVWARLPATTPEEVAIRESYRTAVQTGLLSCIGQEDNTFSGENYTSLELSRNICALAIAADVIDWTSAVDEAAFKAWLRVAIRIVRGGKSVISTHEERPNNWGTHAGASRVAVAVYTGDTAEIARCAQVFRGWLGDRSAYDGFEFGDLDWQSDPAHPVGVNPAGARILGHPVGGVLPDDQRRDQASEFIWPPTDENYTHEAMQGALAQALILRGQGYRVWGWSQCALIRAAWWNAHVNDFPPEGDDLWQSPVLNRIYPPLSLPTSASASPGKSVGYTPWTTLAPGWPQW